MPLPVILPGFKAARYYTGASLGATDWFVIDQARVDAFGRATGADDWIYCDPERAERESPWKAPVVQGYLLLSLAPDLLPRLVELIGWKTAVNAGVEGCTFPAPAPVGSRIRMAAVLDRARHVPGGGVRLTFAVEFQVEGASDPACVARVHYVYFR
ncbi:MAG: dehydratase [Myxococcota bacterium]